VIEEMKLVAIGRVVLTSREHIIAMEPRGKGIMGTLLRFQYEVRNEKGYFDDIPNSKLGRRSSRRATLTCDFSRETSGSKVAVLCPEQSMAQALPRPPNPKMAGPQSKGR
jgi:hypothetical protein